MDAMQSFKMKAYNYIWQEITLSFLSRVWYDPVFLKKEMNYPRIYGGKKPLRYRQY